MWTIIQENKPPHITVYADIPSMSLNGGTIPPDILVTGVRPDLVIIDYTSKHITLLELTCSFESNADAANVRKCIRYNDLKDDLIEQGYKVTLLPFEIGVRSQINQRNRTAINDVLRLSQIGCHKTRNKLIRDMGQISTVFIHPIPGPHTTHMD